MTAGIGLTISAAKPGNRGECGHADRHGHLGNRVLHNPLTVQRFFGMRKRHQGLTVLHLVFIDQFDHIRTADTDHNRGTSHRDQIQLISNQGQHSCGPEHPEHHH